MLAEGPHGAHRGGPRQQRHVELHQFRRQVRQQAQGDVAIAHTVGADAEALGAHGGHGVQEGALRHVRVRRADVDHDLPGEPSGLAHLAQQRGEPSEIREGPGEDVDVQGEQRLSARRGSDRQRGQPPVEFRIATGLRQDVAGLRAGEDLQRRDPSGRQVDDRLEGEADSVRPGGHSSMMSSAACAGG